MNNEAVEAARAALEAWDREHADELKRLYRDMEDATSAETDARCHLNVTVLVAQQRLGLLEGTEPALQLLRAVCAAVELDLDAVDLDVREEVEQVARRAAVLAVEGEPEVREATQRHHEANLTLEKSMVAWQVLAQARRALTTRIRVALGEERQTGVTHRLNALRCDHERLGALTKALLEAPREET